MLAKLIDVRVHNFTPENENKEVRGYRVSFLIPSRNPDMYSPTLVMFYVCEEDARGHGQVFKELLGDSLHMTKLEGIGDYEIGYLYAEKRKLQSLTFLKKVK